MSKLKKILMAAGFGLGVMMLGLSTAITPANANDLSDELENEEEEVEEPFDTSQQTLSPLSNPLSPFDARMKRILDNAITRITNNPEEAANEHFVLLHELYKDLEQHPPLDEDKEKYYKAVEILEARSQEKRFEK